jgi:hypothetical protein
MTGGNMLEIRLAGDDRLLPPYNVRVYTALAVVLLPPGPNPQFWDAV